VLRPNGLRSSTENQISIWLSLEAYLGVKWKVIRCIGSRRNVSQVFFEASTPDLPLTTQSALVAATAGSKADDGFREMDFEIVADNVPVRGGSVAAEQFVVKCRAALLAADSEALRTGFRRVEDGRGSLEERGPRCQR